MFTATLIIIAKKWHQPKCPSTNEWLIKMWYIHRMEHYLAVKKNEVMIHATTWMDSESIMLSERSQTRKTTYCMIPHL